MDKLVRANNHFHLYMLSHSHTHSQQLILQRRKEIVLRRERACERDRQLERERENLLFVPVALFDVIW